eukprot:269086_1
MSISTTEECETRRLYLQRYKELQSYSKTIQKYTTLHRDKNNCPHQKYNNFASYQFVDILLKQIDPKNGTIASSKSSIPPILPNQQLCFECSVIILQKTQCFKNIVDKLMPYITFLHMVLQFRNKTFSPNATQFESKITVYRNICTLLGYLQCRDWIRIIISVINHSEIVLRFYRNKVLFHKFLRILWQLGLYRCGFDKTETTAALPNDSEISTVIRYLLKDIPKYNKYTTNMFNRIKELKYSIVIEEYKTIKLELTNFLHHQFYLLLHQLECIKYAKWIQEFEGIPKEFRVIPIYNDTAESEVHHSSTHTLVYCGPVSVDDEEIKIDVQRFDNDGMSMFILNMLSKLHTKHNIDCRQLMQANKATVEFAEELYPLNYGVFQLHKRLTLANICCGNKKCKKKYLYFADGCSFIRVGYPWKICSQCKISYYCSRKCQKVDWKIRHRDICVRF